MQAKAFLGVLGQQKELGWHLVFFFYGLFWKTYDSMERAMSLGYEKKLHHSLGLEGSRQYLFAIQTTNSLLCHDQRLKS